MDPDGRRRRRREWKRWERGRPNELWQIDMVGGFLLAGGGQVKALSRVDGSFPVLCLRETDGPGTHLAGV